MELSPFIEKYKIISTQILLSFSPVYIIPCSMAKRTISTEETTTQNSHFSPANQRFPLQKSMKLVLLTEVKGTFG
jgi:hypothetical protein